MTVLSKTDLPPPDEEVRPPAGPDSESNHHHATADNDSIGSGDQDQPDPLQGYGTGAPIYLEAGWLSPLPVPHGQKTPVPSGFTGHKGEIPTLDRFQQWIRDRPSDNLAIRMPSDVIGIDVDAYKGKKGAQTLAEGEKRYGRLPAGPSSSSRGFGPSGILYFRVPPGTMLPGKIECLVDGEKTSDIEIIQRHHRYAVVWPSVHPEGGGYQWFDADGDVMDGPPRIEDLPELPQTWLEGLAKSEVSSTKKTGTTNRGEGLTYDVSDALTEGEMSEKVAQRLGVAIVACQGGSRHDTVRDHVLALLRYNKNGEPGVMAAVDALMKAFVNAVAEDREGGERGAGEEFMRFITGAGEMLGDDDLGFGQDWTPPRRASTDDRHQAASAGQGSQKSRVVQLIPASEIRDSVPRWAWEHDGDGRILLSALTLFGGRPGAGKSTAARYFAAEFTRGTMPGCWEGQPQNVAYIAAEEPLDLIVKPSLRASGADLDRMFFPRVSIEDKHVKLLSTVDEDALTELFLANDIKIVVVDPVMATIAGAVDVHRNNEVREYLEPWTRIAERINGIVIAIVHLKKATTGDIVAAVTGSSAFGEVARCVFGFAKDPNADDDERVMSQAKNSCGPEDLSLTYAIETVKVTTDSGETAKVGRFVIKGDSDVTVSDILGTARRENRLSPTMQALLTFVNDRQTTDAAAVTGAGLTTNSKAASQGLRRLYDRGLISLSARGVYEPRPSSSREGE